jgi:hypothetical protein
MVLPILSVALINLHAAVWPVFYIILIPYILDGLNIKIGIIQSHGYRLTPLFIAGFAAAITALLNPYTTDAISYLYYSYGNIYIDTFIIEMESPSFKHFGGLLLFTLYVSVVLAYCLNRNGTTRLRYALLTLMTAYMGLSSARSLQYFFITVPFLAYYYRDFDILSATKTKKERADIVTYIKVCLLILIYTIIIFKAPRHTEKEFYDNHLPVGPAEFIINHFDLDNIRLFNDYDMGDYLEFKGIKTFIDSRADVFLKSNNKKDDILNDYFEVLMGKTHYVDFIAKYKFSHFLVVRGSLMDTYLSRDSNMVLLYEDKKFRILGHEKQ